MTNEAIPQPSDTPVPGPEAPAAEPRSGSGADTALKAMIRKRQMGTGAEPTVPGDGARKLPPKR
jgi:hypothetical protein